MHFDPADKPLILTILSENYMYVEKEEMLFLTFHEFFFSIFQLYLICCLQMPSISGGLEFYL